jgi:hypothetical protein
VSCNIHLFPLYTLPISSDALRDFCELRGDHVAQFTMCVRKVSRRVSFSGYFIACCAGPRCLHSRAVSSSRVALGRVVVSWARGVRVTEPISHTLSSPRVALGCCVRIAKPKAFASQTASYSRRVAPGPLRRGRAPYSHQGASHQAAASEPRAQRSLRRKLPRIHGALRLIIIIRVRRTTAASEPRAERSLRRKLPCIKGASRLVPRVAGVGVAEPLILTVLCAGPSHQNRKTRRHAS